MKQVALLRVTNGRESSRGFKLKYGFTGKSRGSRVSLFTRAARLRIYCCRFKKETGDARGSCKSSDSVGRTPSSRNSFRAPVFFLISTSYPLFCILIAFPASISRRCRGNRQRSYATWTSHFFVNSKSQQYRRGILCKLPSWKLHPRKQTGSAK